MYLLYNRTLNKPQKLISGHVFIRAHGLIPVFMTFLFIIIIILNVSITKNYLF